MRAARGEGVGCKTGCELQPVLLAAYAFIDAISITNRYFTSLFSIRS